MLKTLPNISILYFAWRLKELNVRVRGIYATALAKMLLNEKFNIVHASRKIKNRLKLKNVDIPPDVTIKDLDDRHGVIVLGEYEASKKVYDLLSSKLPEVFTWKSKLPLHSIVKGVVVKVENGRSLIDLSNGLLGGLNEPLNIGEEVIVDIAKPVLPPSNTVAVSRKYTIYGKYVTLIHGLKGKVMVSRHIVDPKTRRNLITLTSLMKIEGDWGIKWRSAAAIGKIDELMLDVQNTLKKAEEILREADKAKISEIVYEGQFFGILGFSYNTKRVLDRERNNVLPTVIGHHMFKSLSNNLTVVTDFSEHLLSRNINSREKLSKALLEFVVSTLNEKSKISIEHVSLFENSIKHLTPGTPYRIEIEDNIVYGVLRRTFKGKGIYDGLMIPKEPGDYDLMEFSTNSYIILHKYFSNKKEFKGIYININTPPEISDEQIRYFDLEVDVIAKSNGETKILDLDKLRRIYEENIITKTIYEKVLEISEEIRKYVSNLNINELSELTLKQLMKNITSIRANLKNI